ncbi:hypothetical protein ACFLUR_02595 [Chloroflexota bacterium]
MGVYVVMRPDEDIGRKAARFKSVVILGCAVCANISIAYDKNMPVSRVLVDKETGRTRRLPVAIVEEANRFKAFLNSKGIDARVDALPSLCRFSYESGPDDLSLAKLCTNAEAVVILACQAGIVGVKMRLGGTAKILPGMKTVGLCQSYTFTDHEKGLVYIDKSRSTLIRIFK